MRARHRYLRRHDGRYRGFSVRITRRGRTHSRFFADKSCGGRGAALRAALQHRDDMLLELEPPVRVRRFFPHNRTGAVGVFLERRRISGRIYPRYCAQWPRPGSPRHVVRRYFAVKRMGKRRAFELACQARREGVAELQRRLRALVAREVVTRSSRDE